MYSFAMGQTKKKEEKQMEPTSFHGSKAVISIAAILAICVCTVVGTYRLKKSAQIRQWQKAHLSYSLKLENENRLAKGNYSAEEK